MLQRISIIGHLGKDAEVKTKPSDGTPFLKFSVAATKKKKDAEETTWYDVLTSNPKMLSEKFTQYLKKGTCVYVEGDFSARNDIVESKVYLHLTINADTIKFISTGKRNEESNNVAASATGETLTAGSGPVTSKAKTVTEAAPAPAPVAAPAPAPAPVAAPAPAPAPVAPPAPASEPMDEDEDLPF